MDTCEPAEPATAAGMPLERQLLAKFDRFIATRPPGADEDVHMLPEVVDHVIQRCTAPGDLVLDPFAGFGTTLDRAVTAGREAIGVELLADRVQYLRNRVPAAKIIQGDARNLGEVLAQAAGLELVCGIQLVLTSPPYMTARHHPADPLTGYVADDGDYHRYLRELSQVAAHCAQLLAPGGYTVWNVADIYDKGHTTRLIADCARALTQHLSLVGITQILWDRYPHDLTTDALLVFQAP